MRFGVTGRKTVIIHVHPRITVLYPPTLTLTAHSCGPFHLGMVTSQQLTVASGYYPVTLQWVGDNECNRVQSKLKTMVF